MRRGLEQPIGISLSGKAQARPIVRAPQGIEELETLLRTRQAFAAPFFKFLEAPYYHHSRWRIADLPEGHGLAMQAPMDTGGTPSVYLQGEATAVQQLLGVTDFPRYSYLTCFDAHLDVIQHHFFLKGLQRLLRMQVTPQSFRTGDFSRAAPIGADRLSSINDLYRMDSGAWVSYRQVADGAYYGVWDEGRLVSIAGTQAVSRTYGIAMVANVLTHPAYRGLGYATACVGALTERLLQEERLAVLNVQPQNAAALRVYRKLGYEDAGPLAEAWAVWKGRRWWDKVLAGLFSWLPN